MASGDEPTEIEVKLGVDDPTAVRAVIRQPEPARLAGFRGLGRVRRRTVVDRYFDTATPLGALEAAGFRARLRSSGGQTEVTLKRGGVARAGVTERLELEGPATPRLEPAAWPPSPVRTVLLQLVGERRLVETGSLRQRRLVRHLARGETLVELSLDDLAAPARGRPRARRWELEAELLSGDRAALEALAAALAELPGTGPALGSKRDLAVAGSRSPNDP